MVFRNPVPSWVARLFTLAVKPFLEKGVDVQSWFSRNI